jgi:hypothetical protein
MRFRGTKDRIPSPPFAMWPFSRKSRSTLRDAKPFASPEDLWNFALETVSLLREAGFPEAGQLLEAGARYSTSSGWEWLGELGSAATNVRQGFTLPEPLASRVLRIVLRATSDQPYGQA